MSMISFLGYNIEDTTNKIFQVCCLLTSGDGVEKVIFLVVWVRICCGRVKRFRNCMGQNLNLT